MKMGKIIFLGLMLAMLFSLVTLSFSSCSRSEAPGVTPTKSWSERLGEIAYEWNEAGSLVESFGEQYNADAKDLTVYDYEEFKRLHGSRFPIRATISSSPEIFLLQQYHASFPVESVKLVDKDTICVLYELEMDSGERTLAYVVFKRKVASFTDDDGFDKAGDYERWLKVGELYFVSEDLTQDDFSDVNVGDSLLSVIETAPAIRFDAEYYSNSTQTHKGITAYQILSDGMMIIEFHAPKDAETNTVPALSEYTVTQKTFYPYSGKKAPEYASLTLKQLSALINN